MNAFGSNQNSLGDKYLVATTSTSTTFNKLDNYYGKHAINITKN